MKKYNIYAKLLGAFTLVFVANDIDFAKDFAKTYNRVNETAVIVKSDNGAQIDDKDYLFFK